MQKSGRWLVSFVLLGVLPALLSASVAAAGPVRILPFGDSLTAGGFSVNGQYQVGGGYRTLLWKLLNSAGDDFVFVGQFQDGPAELPDKHHEGHSGRRIDEIAAGATQWVTAAKPDIVMLLIGTNDIVQNWNLDAAPARLGALVDEIRAAAPRAQILVSNLIPTNNFDLNDRVDAYNAAIARVVARKMRTDTRLRFVDMFGEAGLRDGTDGGESDLLDGVHPTPHGYDLMAQVWYGALRAVLPLAPARTCGWSVAPGCE